MKAAPVDDYIGRVVVARLSEPDAASLLAPADTSGQAAALRAEAQAIRARLDTLGADYALGVITRADLLGGRQAGDARLSVILADLADFGKQSALAPMLAAESAARAWDELPDDRRRAVIDALMTVTLLPPGRGVRIFDDSSIRLDWRAGDEDEDVSAAA